MSYKSITIKKNALLTSISNIQKQASEPCLDSSPALSLAMVIPCLPPWIGRSKLASYGGGGGTGKAS